jgi:hypothetical protein
MGGTLVLEIPARAWLFALGVGHSGLDGVPDAALNYLRTFDYVWLQGVWQTGKLGVELDRGLPERRAVYDQVLPGWTEDDVVGSPYAIYDYRVAAELGGDDALKRFRERLHPTRLLLDFVPNHMARDCPWPERFFLHSMDGAEALPPVSETATRHWQNLQQGELERFQERYHQRLAGRDPYCGPWPDTAQLNYREPALRQHQCQVLCRIADMADGIRADMAMMVLNDVFEWSWRDAAAVETAGPAPDNKEFWEEAIAAVRQRRPDFLFLAEVYWDYEERLQALGFDATYDKKLYDLLHQRHLDRLRGYLRERSAEFHARCVHFVENHDEPRAASHFGDVRVANAAAALSFLLPGIRLEFWGQSEGRRARLDVHLRRAAAEPERSVSSAQTGFYDRLHRILMLPILRQGRFVYSDQGPMQHWRIITWNWYLDNRAPGDCDAIRHLHIAANYSDEAVHYQHAYPCDLLNPDATNLCELSPWTVRVLCEQKVSSSS